MREFLKNMKVSFLLASVLYIALGLVLLIWPGITSDLICLSFGLLLLIYGIITIISFFVHDSRLGTFRFELILGIVAAAAGLLFLIKPEFVKSVIPVVLGIYIIIDALLNLKRSLELHSLQYGRWWVILVLSLVSVALGVLILFRPGMTADVLIMVIGGVFVYNGLSDLWSIFKISRITKEYRKNNPIIIDPIDIE
ncbi:hypothetical protein GMD88_17890 [Pseudoflavonifractor sp. BIOML-A6]|nr:DUF308 domain-containing protein [Pseudoflavonifractor sp. BIOML-A11]MTQ98649.1 hypothetical protein [Pseudoflavonifractor sp. BIOML-A16]MTR07894.1 hypothetical protein [Pseudoflavonifractor sp. BIOML-A15]MTR12669.1 hypothetical protein [Pseudoflavonifractor sp. BIOML-A17]MTR22729.1 hypothetical protein [Pseudoflavonifractor sp. BIOML-A19]MTR34137.1 hypothetical protein [Pseudoflavonifractor sp. BIOML-A14]MTR37559.1 hypothetical protein [Pseudoflavonifractor sp. BIOML-A9]MTR46979.1 hypoth